MNSEKRISRFRRDLLKFKCNVGGHESNPNIQGNENKVIFGSGMGQELQETLLRKAGHHVGRILEGGTDIVVAPAKWLSHMQDNWLTYIVCATILMIGCLLIYCCIRRKLSSFTMPSLPQSNLSKMVMDDIVKVSTFKPALPSS